MKKTAEKIVIICDNCGSDNCVFHHCAGCGKDFCYNCQENKSVGQKLPHGVYCSGSTDCFLCNPCITVPTPAVQAILAAYLKIRQLRNENKTFQDDFKQRRIAAETKVKEVAEKYSIN